MRISNLRIERIFFGCAVAIVLAVSVFSCSKPASSSGKKLKFGVVTNAVAPFWNPMVKGMEQAAKEFGIEASWRGPQNARVDEQKRILEEYVSEGVKGICISPIKNEAIGPEIDRMIAQGLLVITMDSDAPNSKRLAYIGTNNFQAGVRAGQEAIRVLAGQPAKAIAFVGDRGAQNAQERLGGFITATKDHGIQVLEVREDQTDKAKARANAENAILEHPEVNLLLGLWSYNGPAIAAAVDEQKKHGQVKIVCFDAEPLTLANLKTGKVDVTIVQRPFMFGYLSVQLLNDIAKMGIYAAKTKWQAGVRVKTKSGDLSFQMDSKAIIDTGVEAIVPNNVQDPTTKTVNDYLKDLEALGIQSS